EMLSKKRNKNLVVPRQIAMYLCRKMTDASLPLIGDQFGGRDHTTVIHSVDKITREISEQVELSGVIKELCKKIDPDVNEK
ncbi:MAG TPA: helix-turn-helix domain-containing protein, partial [Syntrophomonas sp.]|nr:helix-turn-helix domain-containing protein [Syntrophomonas sp.]